mgnify:CR=1 FL=1
MVDMGASGFSAVEEMPIYFCDKLAMSNFTHV